MRDVLVVVPDLFFNVKITDAVRALGGTPVDVTPATAAERAPTADLVVVDASPAAHGMDVVRLLKSNPLTATVPILAFGAHVDVVGQRAAITAGVDRLVTRGKLSAELPTLLMATARKHDENGQ